MKRSNSSQDESPSKKRRLKFSNNFAEWIQKQCNITPKMTDDEIKKVFKTALNDITEIKRLNRKFKSKQSEEDAFFLKCQKIWNKLIAKLCVTNHFILFFSLSTKEKHSYLGHLCKQRQYLRIHI